MAPEPPRRPGRPRRDARMPTATTAARPAGIRRNPERTNRARPGHWAPYAEARLLAAIDMVEATEGLRSHEVPVPQTYKQAISGKHADRWKAAMERQIAEIDGMKAYDIVPRSEAGKNRVLHGK